MSPDIKCVFPGCDADSQHTHHVTYQPPVTKRLCRKHHEDITIINGQQARKSRSRYWRGAHYIRLSNKHRWWIWFQWTEGKLKPRRTKKALEWLKDWDQFDRGQIARPTLPGAP